MSIVDTYVTIGQKQLFTQHSMLIGKTCDVKQRFDASALSVRG